MELQRLFVAIVVLTFMIVGCSPQTSNEMDTEVVEEEETLPAVEDPNTPCTTLNQLSGYVKEEVETAFVLYRDQIKLKNFDAAFPLWQRAFYGAPGANGKVKYHFNDGIAIYKHMFGETNNKSKQKAYMDSVTMIYDKRIECFGDEAYVAGRKAFDYYYTFNEFVSEDTIYNLFKQNIDEKGKKADYFVINPFTKILFDRIVQDKLSMQEGREYARLILDAVEYGSENCKKSKNCAAWDIIQDYAPIRLEALEGMNEFWDCEYYTDKYYPKYELEPDNCDVIELVFRRMSRGECPDDDPKFIEIKNAKATKCYTPPPPPGPLKRAFNAYSEGDYRNAITLFEEFVEKTEDVDKKAKYTLLIAKIYYGDIKDFPMARKYARKAAEYRDNWGEPYMLIGKLYASSGPLCGPGRGWASQIVTWPAIDKFRYAKSIDPEVADEANKLIRQYRQYMPNREDIFQRSINEGDSFRVGCWIQETTRVRTP